MATIRVERYPVPEGSSYISSGYGWRTLYGEPNNHRGIDLACPAGTPIFAVAPGVVGTATFNSGGFGNYVTISHDGWTSLYAHMQSYIVSPGQSVTAGQQIGYVDSTGNSTGNHLHFEIWSGNTRDSSIDPTSYLQGNVSYVEGGVSGAEEESSSGINMSLDPANLQVYAETTYNLTQQPIMSFIDMYVGDEKITLLPPQYVVSFEFNRFPTETGGGGEFILSVFDTHWEMLEHLFSNNFNNIKFRYGHVTGKQSKIWSAQVSTYTVDYNTEGVYLNIKGVTSGVLENLSNITMDTGTLNPTESAKRICEEVGWQVFEENFHPSLSVESPTRDSFTIVEEKPATFIINKLAPLAVRASDGLSGYRFFLDDSEEPAIAHFHPMDILENTRRTYVYMKGVDSPIESLTLTVNGVFGGVGSSLTTTGLTSTIIDPDTKEETTISETLNSARIYATGEYSHTNTNQSTNRVDSAGRSVAQMNAVLNYRLSGPQAKGYEGILTLVGDPSLEMTETIRLLIITDNGDLHHTSGLYYIDAISDSISNGIMKSTVNIIKYDDLSEGLQLVNYRTLLK